MPVTSATVIFLIIALVLCVSVTIPTYSNYKSRGFRSINSPHLEMSANERSAQKTLEYVWLGTVALLIVSGVILALQ